jgi:hypothetical protein
MLSIQPMREDSLLRVEVIQYHIGIGRTAGGKDDNLSAAGQFAKEIVAMRAHSDACLYFEISTEMVDPPYTGKSNLTV